MAYDGCVSPISTGSHYRTVQCKVIGNSRSFSFGGGGDYVTCRQMTSSRQGRILSAEDVSALLHQHVLWGTSPSEWLAPVSQADLWPRLRGHNCPNALSRVLGESFTRWMFKVAELCFVKVCVSVCMCVFALRHVESADPLLLCVTFSPV